MNLPSAVSSSATLVDPTPEVDLAPQPPTTGPNWTSASPSAVSVPADKRAPSPVKVSLAETRIRSETRQEKPITDQVNAILQGERSVKNGALSEGPNSKPHTWAELQRRVAEGNQWLDLHPGPAASTIEKELHFWEADIAKAAEREEAKAQTQVQSIMAGTYILRDDLLIEPEHTAPLTRESLTARVANSERLLGIYKKSGTPEHDAGYVAGKKLLAQLRSELENTLSPPPSQSPRWTIIPRWLRRF